MKINPTTLLFEDLTDDEREELRSYAESVVIDGVFPQPEPHWVAFWAVMAGYDHRQKLIVMSTVLPQRILLSILPPRQKQPQSGIDKTTPKTREDP